MDMGRKRAEGKKGKAKSAVMQPKYRSRVERDRTKYKRKRKHKGDKHGNV